MFIRSLNLNLNDKNTKVILAVISIALLIAITLIVITSTLMYKEKENCIEETNIFNVKNYHVKANVKVYSNKNSNEYRIEEFCTLNSDGKIYSKMISENEDGEKLTYLVNDEYSAVKSENQKIEYSLSKYALDQKNLLSVSTFINLYNDTSANIDNLSIDGIIRYKITLDGKKHNLMEDVKKLELVYDKENSKILEYIVYNEVGNAFIDMEIKEFDINKKFDEKIFAF